MGNHIVIEPAKKIREIARKALVGYWQPVIIGVAIYYLLASGVSSVLDYFFSFSYPIQMYGQNLISTVSYGGSLYEFILGGPLQYGVIMYMLAFFRSKQTDNTILFEGFSNFGKSFLLLLLMSIKIFLWSLLFAIPGIIAALRYSQAFYVMVDNPDLTVSQCIKESCRIMEGNKGRFFYLLLTFLGWYILAVIPSAVYINFSDCDSFLSVILTLVLSLPILVVDTYMMMSNTAFYELATERLVVVNEYSNMTNADYTVKENLNPKYEGETQSAYTEPTGSYSASQADGALQQEEPLQVENTGDKSMESQAETNCTPDDIDKEN